jgi:type I restriction enzyme S subunit
MMDGLKPYPAYKDSGVPWLGQVPEHWEVKGNKFLLQEVNERSEDGSEELLTVSQYTGVTLRRERLAGEGDLLTNAASLVGYKRVKPGDLVMNIMLAWNGSLGVSSITGIVSPSYCVFRTKRDGVDSRFLHYLFRTSSYTGAFKTVSTGVVDSRLRLYPDVFLRLPSLVPPLPEQTAIVRFLDYRDRRIRRSIRAKQKLIKLLEEYRQALIHQAVTGKIDVRTGKPYPAYKDSGVPWLGKVPEHWEVRRLRTIVELRVSNVDKHSKEDEQPVRLCNYVHVYKHERIRANMDFMKATASAEEVERFRLEQGDVLITKDSEAWDDIGVPALVESSAPDLISGYHLALLRPSHVVEGAFLLRALQSSQVAYQFHVEASGVTRYGLSHDAIKSALVPLPPLPEQTAIVEYLDAQTAKLDTAIAAARREIELLREYRERLIADVVTGKVDVREVAAQLPEEPPEEEAGTEEEEPVAEELATVDSLEESNGEE